MHIAAQKDLQRTTIYPADAHEMCFRKALVPSPAELKRYAEALPQPVQT
jgi:predicted Abi (CAAX) family protease